MRLWRFRNDKDLVAALERASAGDILVPIFPVDSTVSSTLRIDRVPKIQRIEGKVSLVDGEFTGMEDGWA